jgi:hypothetical protein
MLELKDFMKKVQKQHLILAEDSRHLTGGQNGDYTETGEDTVNCDYYATLDGDADCWRLDQNCCPT